MKRQAVSIQLICGLFVALWVYAATTKLMDPQKFLGQLNQSPLLMPFATTAMVAVPAMEYLLVLGLMLTKFRLYALWGSYSLMAAFTFYILAIMHFSPFVPCSCGGILEKMSWNQHLLFNILFVILGATGFFLQRKTMFESTRV